MLRTNTFLKSILVSFLLLFMEISLFANDNNSEKEISLFDKKDGALDLSSYMSQAYGFTPVPLIITEPSVGYGLGATLVYLHNNITGEKSKSGRRVPPSMSGIIFAATQNGTKVSGAFHIGYWLDDSLRTTTYIGYPDIRMNIYKNDNAIEMKLHGVFAYQNIKSRLGESDFFLGGSYMYMAPEASFSFQEIEQDYGKKSTISSVGVILDYDSRDNKLSPNQGILITAKVLFYDESIGSDYDLQRYKATGLFYNKVTKNINLDFNFMLDQEIGDKIPPYLLPSVAMRGIALMRYQGKGVLSLQVQSSYSFAPRWRGLVFGGIARTYGETALQNDISLSDAKNIYAGGIGFRYLLARKFGLRAGIDIATSEHNNAFYIQFGSAWRGF